MNTDVMFSSKTDEWATPQDLFDYFNSIYHFTLDVCADETNHKCEKYFTKEMDGLKQNWDGVFWMNPPYGRDIGKWVEKAYNEAYKHDDNAGVLLLPARTDTKWFHKYCVKGDIIFIKGRLKFGNSKNSAPFPSMIVIFSGVAPNTFIPIYKKGSCFPEVLPTYKTVYTGCTISVIDKQ